LANRQDGKKKKKAGSCSAIWLDFTQQAVWASGKGTLSAIIIYLVIIFIKQSRGKV
jgi:hypothetical protein